MDIDQTKKRKRNIVLADAGLLLVALIWGSGFVIGKFALQGLSPMNIMTWRYLGAAFVMAWFCIKKWRLINKKMILCSLMVGFLMFLGNGMQTVGLQYTTPGKQSFIMSMYTVIVPFLSWAILKTKPSKRIAAAACMALVGIALLTLRDDLTIGLGDSLTFIFALTFSLQVIFISVFMRDMDAILFTFLEILAAGIFSLAALFITDTPANLTDVQAGPLVALLWLAVFNTALAFLLQNLCQRFAPANHTAILLSTETLFGTILAVTVAGEVFRGRMIPGCVLMFAAIIVCEFPVSGKKKKCP